MGGEGGWWLFSPCTQVGGALSQEERRKWAIPLGGRRSCERCVCVCVLAHTDVRVCVNSWLSSVGSVGVSGALQD